MKTNQIMFVNAVIIFMFSATISYASGPHWTHEEQLEWGAIEDTEQTKVPHIYPYAECAIGSHQSPIDFAAAEISTAGSLDRPVMLYDVDIPVFFNSGHGVQVNTSLDYPGRLEVGNESFPLIQFHFHSPSEHVIGEIKFAAELHYVHVREDGRIVVLAVAINEGEENATFQTILDNMPHEEGGRREGTGISIDPKSLLPADDTKLKFFSLAGSLTTPPCSEGVQWYLLSQAITISTAQLDQLKGFYSDNSRLPQDLNGRALLTTD